MTYSTLLFDIDDTLLDFQSSEKKALTALFAELHHPLTSAMLTYYHDLNVNLWQQFERGQITKQALLESRFTRLFKHFGETVNGAAVERQYRYFLAKGHDQIPHATQLLTDLSQRHDMYIVTNGIAATQKQRIAEAGMAKFFKAMFVSEKAGARKPEKAFFDYAASHIDHFNKSATLVIGDSLTSDILGAKIAGLDSVWFNPHHSPNQTLTQPTYEIDALLKLKPIVASS